MTKKGSKVCLLALKNLKTKNKYINVKMALTQHNAMRQHKVCYLHECHTVENINVIFYSLLLTKQFFVKLFWR